MTPIIVNKKIKIPPSYAVVCEDEAQCGVVPKIDAHMLNSFPDHRGRKGEVGGSVSRDVRQELSKPQKTLITEMKTKQREFEKTTPLGLRWDMDVKGNPLPLSNLTNHLNAIAGYQRENLKSHPTSGFRYGGMEDFVTSVGSEMKSPYTPPQIKLMPPKECYSNATEMAVFNQPDKYDYAEGFVTLPKVPFPVQHAWCVDKITGTVVDPTMGWNPRGNYFGIKFDRRFVLEKMMQNKFYGVLSGRDMVTDLTLGIDKDYHYAK